MIKKILLVSFCIILLTVNLSFADESIYNYDNSDIHTHEGEHDCDCIHENELLKLDFNLGTIQPYSYQEPYEHPCHFTEECKICRHANIPFDCGCVRVIYVCCCGQYMGETVYWCETHGAHDGP